MMRRRLATLVTLVLTLSAMLPIAGVQATNDSIALDSRVYELVEDPLDWKSARKAAVRHVAPGCMRAHLATITSDAERDVLTLLMDGVTENNAWLGGRQPRGNRTLEDGWKWITGEKWVNTYWALNEPNDTPFGTYIAGSEQHLEALNAGDAGTWNDAPGFETKFYVVESERCDNG